MRVPLTYLTLLVLTLASASCTKNKPTTRSATDTASIIGTWTWAYQSKALWDFAPGDTTPDGHPILTPYTAANTGISRTLIFDTAGNFTFIHNDSVFVDSTDYEPNYLQVATPIRLLPAMQQETDTGFYRVSFGIVGCSFADTTTLTLQNVPYQAILTADTLLIHLDPCLSRVIDIYVRKP
jgi:hypothetical protein